MGLISIGIDGVMAFELPTGVWADGEITAGPRVCLVRWRSSLVDKIHQVYVNGRFAGATVEGRQRQIVVQKRTLISVMRSKKALGTAAGLS